MGTQKNSTIAKRYAKSLFDLTKENNISSDDAINNLKNVETILKDSQDLYSAMTNPIVSAKDKEEIVDLVFSKDTNEITRNFLKLLIDKNRFNLIFNIINVFKEILDEFNNIAHVDITCATKLTSSKQKEIMKKLNSKLNKKVEVTYKKDSSIIAGLVFRIGDDIVDTSINHKLEELRKEILK